MNSGKQFNRKWEQLRYPDVKTEEKGQWKTLSEKKKQTDTFSSKKKAKLYCLQKNPLSHKHIVTIFCNNIFTVRGL